MSRVRVDKTAFTLGADGRLRLAPGRDLYVYERGTEDEAVGYTTEGGATQVTYPLTANSEGKYVAWYPPDSYDLYTPADDDTEPWEAVDGVESGSLAVVMESPPSPEDPEYGALGDGSTNDTTAFQDLIDDKGVMGLRPGARYRVGQLTLDTLSQVHIDGRGAEWERIPSGSPDQAAFGNIEDCTDVEITRVRFDCNNIERFGGWQFTGCDRVQIHHNRFYDSDLNASWSSYDHYAVLVQNSTDVWFTDNEVEDVEAIEHNNVDGLVVARNIIRGAAGTAAIIWAAVSNGYYLRHAKIVDNIIVDSRGKAIALQYEASGIQNNELYDIEIARNRIVRQNVAALSKLDMLIGDAVTGTPSGNTNSHIDIVDNTFIRDPGLTDANTATVLIADAGDDFTYVTFAGNKSYGTHTGEWAFDLRNLNKFRCQNNEVWDTEYGMVWTDCSNGAIDGNVVEASTDHFAKSGDSGVAVGDNWEMDGSPALWVP